MQTCACKFVLAGLCIHTCSGMDSTASGMDMSMVTVEDEGHGVNLAFERLR